MSHARLLHSRQHSLFGRSLTLQTGHRTRSRSLAAVTVRDPLWAAPERGLAAVVAALNRLRMRATGDTQRGGRDSTYAAGLGPSSCPGWRADAAAGRHGPARRRPGQWAGKGPPRPSGKVARPPAARSA